MPDRDAVLAALPPSPGGERPHVELAVKSVPAGAHWDRFVERLQALGGEVRSLVDLEALAGRSFLDPDVPAKVKEKLGKPVQTVWEAEAGVTLCDLAVAETGSLLFAARPGRSRLASLAPPLHVALLRPNHLIASLEEAVAQLPRETCWLVCGPSRTADIEQVLVNGVHGPGRLWVVPLPEELPE